MKTRKARIVSKSPLLGWRNAWLFALLFGLIGVLIIWRSFAASSLLHEYQYNSAGIGHNDGGGFAVDTPSGKAIGWEVIGGCTGTTLGCINGHYMWYGPYFNLNAGSSHVLQTCWTYIAPTSKNFVVLFDVSYTNASGQHILWSSGNKTILASATLAKDVYLDQKFCNSIPLVAGSYPKLEIRAKAVSGGDSSPQNGFKLWKTSWQFLQ